MTRPHHILTSPHTSTVGDDLVGDQGKLENNSSSSDDSDPNADDYNFPSALSNSDEGTNEPDNLDNDDGAGGDTRCSFLDSETVILDDYDDTLLKACTNSATRASSTFSDTNVSGGIPYKNANCVKGESSNVDVTTRATYDHHMPCSSTEDLNGKRSKNSSSAFKSKATIQSNIVDDPFTTRNNEQSTTFVNERKSSVTSSREYLTKLINYGISMAPSEVSTATSAPLAKTLVSLNEPSATLTENSVRLPAASACFGLGPPKAAPRPGATTSTVPKLKCSSSQIQYLKEDDYNELLDFYIDEDCEINVPMNYRSTIPSTNNKLANTTNTYETKHVVNANISNRMEDMSIVRGQLPENMDSIPSSMGLISSPRQQVGIAGSSGKVYRDLYERLEDMNPSVCHNIAIENFLKTATPGQYSDIPGSEIASPSSLINADDIDIDSVSTIGASSRSCNMEKKIMRQVQVTIIYFR